FYTLRDIQEKGYNPLLSRLVLLKTHYRKILDFSFDDFKEAKIIAEKFLSFLAELSFITNGGSNNLDIKNTISRNREEFKKAMDSDLNISLALAALFDFIEEVYKIMPQISSSQAREIEKYIFEIDEVFGFIKPLFEQYQARLNKILATEKIQAMISNRGKARKEKNYAEADKIRGDLLKEGIVVEDMAERCKIRLLEIVE
ncbi:MAG: hypothetical protein L6275_04710, partial [Candidatus Portnoybacteria bacterium]|nr:hypothetical protein [Candidatus Portnoybacteria bacterium]